MNKYETIFIIAPNLEAEETEKTIEDVQNLMTDSGCEITRVDRWGKRRLAYNVKGNRDGYYVIINFEGAPEFVGKLARYYGLAENIIKYMTLRAEKLSTIRAGTAEVEKEASPRKEHDLDDDDDFEEGEINDGEK